VLKTGDRESVIVQLLSFRYSSEFSSAARHLGRVQLPLTEKGFRVVCEVNDAARKKLAD